MKAAIVTAIGKTPVYGEFNEPVPQQGEELITVTASALSHVTRGRASGEHYSSSGQFPLVAGIDGVGRTQDGRRVYFVLPPAPFGGMAERVAVRARQCVALPDEVNDVTAAAIANPGMASWAALKERARLVAGETVLINGATGTAGRLAIQIAKYMGARKVIATGRNAAELEEVKALGADVLLSLMQEPKALEKSLIQEFSGDGINVVIDFLWGQSAEVIIVAAAKGGKDAVPIRFVQIGSVSGDTISLPSVALRSSGLVLMGSGIGSIPVQGLIAAIDSMMQAVVPAKLQIKTKAVPLAEVERTWNADTGKTRVVFTIIPE